MRTNIPIISSAIATLPTLLYDYIVNIITYNVSDVNIVSIANIVSAGNILLL